MWDVQNGCPSRGRRLVAQFVDGQVSALKNLARGYGVSYKKKKNSELCENLNLQPKT